VKASKYEGEKGCPKKKLRETGSIGMYKIMETPDNIEVKLFV
jgi:hypothetical protein